MVSEFYQANKAMIWMVAIWAPLIPCLTHYIAVGPIRTDKKSNGQQVRRFSKWELFAHWARAISFVLLLVTGLMMVFGIRAELHEGMGNLLFLVALITLLIQFKDYLFKPYDWKWLKSLGGYFASHPGALEAGRFNAGQKLFNWLSMLILIGLFITAKMLESSHDPYIGSVHALLGCAFTIVIMGHIYLSMLANPETASVFINGKAPLYYVRHHHSLWNCDRRLVQSD